MDKKMSKKVLVATIVIAMLMLISAMSISSTASDDRTTTLLIEVENAEELEHFRENGNLLMDYDNGMALVKVPRTEITHYKEMFRTDIDDSRYEISLQTSGQKFDRRNGLPTVSSGLKFNDMGGIKPYIVQFIGPLPSVEWKQDIENEGAQFEKDMGNYAVLVRMDQTTHQRVRDMDFVAWTAPYHPGFKISDSLELDEGMVDIQVFGWKGVDEYVIAEKLDAMGATVGRTNDISVIASIDSELVPTIAHMDEVYAIEGYQMTRTLDTVATDIHEATSLWYTSWSGLSSRITGSGQVVGIQDSGFLQGDPDDGHCDFFDGPNGDRVIRYEDRTGNSDPDGEEAGAAHGTHCAGIVLENGWCWDTHLGESTTDRIWHKNEATGMAPEAELSIDGCTAQGGGISSDPAYWDDQESDGARVFSNSWGSGPGDYDGSTEAIDDRQDPYSTGAMTHADEDIILFAAGNDGPGDDTISPRPQTKNGLGIGASQNYRTEWHSAENPNKVADFSSRGGTHSNGRIKPDLVAVGTAVISALGPGEWDYWESSGQGVPQPQYLQEVDEYDYNTKDPGQDGRGDYQYMQGTSMACPNAAGAALLVREYYTDIHGDNTPSNPLVKATMINGADRMSETLYDYPGHDQGWGRINLKNSMYPDTPASMQFDEHTFTGTGTWTPNLNLDINSGDVPLKATLVWVDSSGDILNRQLEFEMESPSGDTYYSGVDNYDTNGWTQPNTDNGDTINNVHRVEVESPEAGAWTMNVNANSIPSDANCAIVISADFGPQDTYDVDLQTDYPTTLSVVQGGQTVLPIRVRNWGNTDDTIDLTDDSPGGLSFVYDPSDSLTLDSEETEYVDVTIAADAGITPDVYEVAITGTSNGDTSVQDNLLLKIQILTEKLPYKTVAADSSVDESYADVLTFTDSGGTDWIFLAYRLDTSDGQQVHAKYSELGTDGRPTGWSSPVNLQAPSSAPTETPQWINLLHIPSGDYEDRVVCYWNGGIEGTDPYRSEAKVTWADTGSYGTWATPVQIDDNYGTDDSNVKRASYMLWRDDGTSDGELMYVFEHLDSSDAGTSGIGIAYSTTDDGGSSWAAPTDVPGAAPGGSYYYFFPHGVTDQNNVNWHFFYYRESSGNSRMVVTKIQDDSGWSDEITVMGDLSGGDNHQFPRAAHINRGGTNEIYCSALYDHGGVDMDLSTAYVTGDYTSSSSPSFTSSDSVSGVQIADSGYIESNVLAATGTDLDSFAWTAYQESGTIFDYVNIDTARTDDHYSTVENDKVTRDNYAKLNPQLDSLSIGSTSYTYLAYHSSQGTATEVDYNIYLAIFHSDWKNDPDTEGPNVYNVAAQPGVVNQSDSFDISATIDDTDTGFNGIADAQWVEDSASDPSAVDWSSSNPMGLSGSSEIETASAPGIDSSGWTIGTHRIWVRGQDDQGNWGTENADYFDLEVTEPDGGGGGTPIHHLGTLSSTDGGGWNFVSFNLTRTDDSLTSILDDGTYGIAGNYDKVMYYSAAENDWKTYVPGRLGHYNDLSTWDNTMGLWIHMTTDDDLSVVGDSKPTTTSITLYPGWNMVSYPSSTSGTDAPADVSIIGYYDAAATYNIAYDHTPGDHTLNPGEAYWFYLDLDTTYTWDVTY